MARVTFTRARSAALPALRSRPPQPDGASQLLPDELQLLAQARGALDVVKALGLVEVLAQLRDPLAVGGLRRRVQQLARVTGVGGDRDVLAAA